MAQLARRRRARFPAARSCQRIHSRHLHFKVRRICTNTRSRNLVLVRSRTPTLRFADSVSDTYSTRRLLWDEALNARGWSTAVGVDASFKLSLCARVFKLMFMQSAHPAVHVTSLSLCACGCCAGPCVHLHLYECVFAGVL